MKRAPATMAGILTAGTLLLGPQAAHADTNGIVDLGAPAQRATAAMVQEDTRTVVLTEGKQIELVSSAGRRVVPMPAGATPTQVDTIDSTQVLAVVDGSLLSLSGSRWTRVDTPAGTVTAVVDRPGRDAIVSVTRDGRTTVHSGHPGAWQDLGAPESARGEHDEDDGSTWTVGSLYGHGDDLYAVVNVHDPRYWIDETILLRHQGGAWHLATVLEGHPPMWDRTSYLAILPGRNRLDALGHNLYMKPEDHYSPRHVALYDSPALDLPGVPTAGTRGGRYILFSTRSGLYAADDAGVVHDLGVDVSSFGGITSLDATSTGSRACALTGRTQHVLLWENPGVPTARR